MRRDPTQGCGVFSTGRGRLDTRQCGPVVPWRRAAPGSADGSGPRGRGRGVGAGFRALRDAGCAVRGRLPAAAGQQDLGPGLCSGAASLSRPSSPPSGVRCSWVAAPSLLLAAHFLSCLFPVRSDCADT